MTKIRILDDRTVNQIKAGEVIENPSSVVKELVENSIDAGSTDIHIEIRGGGRQLIRITDNGCGMSKEDALLCLERHATSKIRLAEDLAHVETMGFRGEAIPSIASISKFQLLTSENELGTMVLVEGGQLIESAEAPRARGTTIEVKSLFYNVPVRRKFQRSPASDINEIVKAVTLQALAHPLIKFQLVSDGKVLLTAKEELRIKEVLGIDFLRGTTPLEGDARIQGVVGFPTFTRQNRTGQYLFVNGRAVVSPLVSYAVRDGYGTALATNRHPVFVLYLTLPGDLVDVNVHPQKREVRMREQEALRDVVVKAVRKALEGARIEETVAVRPVFSFESKEACLEPLPLARPLPVFKEQTFLEEPQEKKPSLRLLATIKGYLIIEGENLTLVDQRRAHARVIFEKLLKEKEKIPVQPLLIPYTAKLAPEVREHLETLNAMGISIHESGPGTFMIDAVPQVFGNVDLERLIHDIIYRMNTFHDTSEVEKQAAKQIAMAASTSAVSSNKKLSFGEGQILLDQLMRTETPLFCPFGKPTHAVFSAEDLEGAFHV